jgi:ubiquitin C-terminal hydrolase
MRGGHYTAYVCARAAKGAGDAPAASRWFHISDTRVSKAEEADVLGAQAFLLFYDRV